MKKVRVIQLIENISDGGAETQLKNYMLYLDKSKFSCILLTKSVDSSSANARVLLDNYAPIFSAMIIKRNLCRKILNKIQRILIPSEKRESYIQWYIQKKILAFKPDVIHVHLKMLHYLLPIADKLQGVKIFYRCASKPERYFNNENELDRSELEAARYLIANNGLQMIALHNQMRVDINELFSISNTIVVHNVFDLSKFKAQSLEIKKEVRKQLGIPIDAFVIGHVGRCFYIKNQSFLVDVFQRVANINAKAYLLMIGSGDFSDVISKLEHYGLKTQYQILSNRSDVHTLLQAMDVFVFPSLLEGMPGALVEAQAAGLKCIASSAITDEAIVSTHAIQMDLADGAQAWADIILNDEFNGKPISSLDSFELKNVLKEVEQLYTA